MKRLLTISIILLACIDVLAQTINRVDITHNFGWRSFDYSTEPTYYPETGLIVVEATADKNGYFKDLSIKEAETTIKDERQRESTLLAAKHSRLQSDSYASDSLRSTITYRFYSLSQIQIDSIHTVQLERLHDKLLSIENSKCIQKYKLYPTDNIWSFLELDTVFGCVYRVQFSVKGEDYRFREIISSQDLREESYYSSNEFIPGRFELYKTQNMYNFLLLDTIDGRVWQVQWSNDSNSGIIRIK